MARRLKYRRLNAAQRKKRRERRAKPQAPKRGTGLRKAD
jgi:hypothetical protein